MLYIKQEIIYHSLAYWTGEKNLLLKPSWERLLEVPSLKRQIKCGRWESKTILAWMWRWMLNLIWSTVDVLTLKGMYWIYNHCGYMHGVLHCTIIKWVVLCTQIYWHWRESQWSSNDLYLKRYQPNYVLYHASVYSWRNAVSEQHYFGWHFYGILNLLTLRHFTNIKCFIQ